MDIDRNLRMGRRVLLHQPHYLTLGPTGRRLFAESLEFKPGFMGCIDFIHKINIPMLFTLDCGSAHWDASDITWYPSHLVMDYQDNRILYHEIKLVTWDDCAISLIRVTNISNEPMDLRLMVNPHLKLDSGHQFTVNLHFGCTLPGLFCEHALPAKDTLSFVCVMGLGLVAEQEQVRVRVQQWLSMSAAKILEQHRLQYQRYFDDAPQLRSNDSLLDKTWCYRLFLLRHNQQRPCLGNLQHIYFCEGRSHNMIKTPYAPSGWEFSKLIPLSAPMHLLDTQWFMDPAQSKGIILSMLDNQLQDGLFHCAYVDKHQDAYANFFAWAVYQYVLASGDLSTARHALPALIRQAEGWRKAYGNDRDLLMRENVHQLTGKEYQPSYWYFNGYPTDPTDPSYITPLKRVDLSVDFVQNLRGIAGLCALLGDTAGSSTYGELSKQAGEDIKRKMWDKSSGYYYDLHHRTDEKSRVKNVVTFYPYWAGLGERGGIEKLFSPDFLTTCPFPSVATSEPMFSPAGGWKGNFFKGRNGCVWNGPSWPYTNSVLLDALARESHRYEHCYDEPFLNLLQRFCLQHFADCDPARHGLAEHYNPLTGEALSGEVDYLHSYFLDLVVRHIAGLEPTPEGLLLQPTRAMCVELELSRVGFRGRELSVTLDHGQLRLLVDHEEHLYNLANGASFLPMPMEACL